MSSAGNGCLQRGVGAGRGGWREVKLDKTSPLGSPSRGCEGLRGLLSRAAALSNSRGHCFPCALIKCTWQPDSVSEEADLRGPKQTWDLGMSSL